MPHDQPPLSEELLQALAVTAEICDRPMSKAAATVMCADLAPFPVEQVLGALTRCRKELTGKLTLQAILTRLADGRPTADEAWAMLPKDEDSSAVLTQETLSASMPAMQIYRHRDQIGARLAFKEAYNRLVQEARDAGKPVKWIPSLGCDGGGRASVIVEAVELGRLPVSQAEAILGPQELRRSLGVSHIGLARIADLTRGLLHKADETSESESLEKAA